MCFVWIWEQTAIISLYNINWLVFITDGEYLLRGTDWVFIYNSGYVWIWEQTPIISLYNINWLVFITETECVYCAVRAEYLNILYVNLSLYVVNINNVYLWFYLNTTFRQMDHFPSLGMRVHTTKQTISVFPTLFIYSLWSLQFKYDNFSELL